MNYNFKSYEFVEVKSQSATRQQQTLVLFSPITFHYDLYQKMEAEQSEDIECILPPYNNHGALYIGNLTAALSLQTLKNLKISAVVSMAKGGFLPHSQDDLPYYLYIQAYDKKDFDLTPYFDKTFDFIEKYRKKTNVLVHCMAGVSRSVTIVIAYLMKKTGRSLVDCFCEVKKSRPVISPNEGFIKQLKNYQEKLKKQKQAGKKQTLTANMPIRPYLKTQRRKSADYYLNKSTQLSNRIEPIDLQAKLTSLRTKYNPEHLQDGEDLFARKRNSRMKRSVIGKGDVSF